MTARGYQQGEYGLKQNSQLASQRKDSADQIQKFEDQLTQGDPHAQTKLGLELLRLADAQPGTRQEGLSQFRGRPCNYAFLFAVISDSQNA